jgi:hypothetical protein
MHWAIAHLPTQEQSFADICDEQGHILRQVLSSLYRLSLG